MVVKLVVLNAGINGRKSLSPNGITQEGDTANGGGNRRVVLTLEITPALLTVAMVEPEARDAILQTALGVVAQRSWQTFRPEKNTPKVF